MDLFVYGTLRCPALLSAIVGRDIPVKAATLVDYAVHPVAGHIVPMIKPQDGAKAIGVVYEGLDQTDQAKLDLYEGAFGYVLVPVVVQLEDEQHDVQMYLPPKGQATVGRSSKNGLGRSIGQLAKDRVQRTCDITRPRLTPHYKASKYPIAGLTAQVAAN